MPEPHPRLPNQNLRGKNPGISIFKNHIIRGGSNTQWRLRTVVWKPRPSRKADAPPRARRGMYESWWVMVKEEEIKFSSGGEVGYILFYILFIVVYHRISNTVLCFKLGSYCLSILLDLLTRTSLPNPQSLPLWQQVCFLCLWFCFYFIDKFICVIF